MVGRKPSPACLTLPLPLLVAVSLLLCSLSFPPHTLPGRLPSGLPHAPCSSTARCPSPLAGSSLVSSSHLNTCYFVSLSSGFFQTWLPLPSGVILELATKGQGYFLTSLRGTKASVTLSVPGAFSNRGESTGSA